MFQIIKLFGATLVKTWFIWIGLIAIAFVFDQLYAFFTLRTKTIQLRSIVFGKILIDSDLNVYNVLSNHILGCGDLHSKILKLKINSYYKIKIYGIDTPFTQVKVIDIETH